MKKLSPEDTALLQDKADLLRENVSEIAAHLYDSLLEKHKEMKQFFFQEEVDHNEHVSAQARAMAQSLLFWCLNFAEEGEHVEEALDRIASKHISRNVSEKYFDWMATALEDSIHFVLGDKVEKQVIVALLDAYNLLKAALMARQEKLAEEFEAKENGFRGLKQFKVTEIQEEKDEEGEMYVHIRFDPADGSKSPEYEFGQYVGLKYSGEAGEHFITMLLDDEKTTSGGLWTSHHKEEADVTLSVLKVGEIVDLSPPAGNALDLGAM